METQVLDPLGVRVTGVSLAEPDRDLVAALRDLLAEHGVVVLPDQRVDDAMFLAFVRLFGDLMFTQGETPVDGFGDLNVISNVGRERPPRSSFHVDTSYVARPPAYTALRAVRIPDRGGATQFTNQYRALETLPESLRRRVEGRAIVHIVTGIETDPGAETSAEHPIVRAHPVSGRPSLYLTTPPRCASVTGLRPEEGDALVARLFEHSTSPGNTLAHPWAAHDVVMWDNGCVLHRGDHDGVVGDRVMHRAMIAPYPE